MVRSPARSSNISKKTQTKGWPTDIHVGNTDENSNAEFVWVLINVFLFANTSSCLMCGLSPRALWSLLPYCWYFLRAVTLKMVYIISKQVSAHFSCINQGYKTFIRCTYVWATVQSACICKAAPPAKTHSCAQYYYWMSTHLIDLRLVGFEVYRSRFPCVVI